MTVLQNLAIRPPNLYAELKKVLSGVLCQAQTSDDKNERH